MDKLLNTTKLALRIAGNDFDDELISLLRAGLADLSIAGVINDDVTDPLIVRALVTFCKLNFGEPEYYDRLKASYDEQKAQLSMATGYTDWLDAADPAPEEEPAEEEADG